MKTLVIVEDQNDAYIFEAIIRHLAKEDSMKVIDTPEWEYIASEPNPEKPTALIKGLQNLTNDFSKGKYNKVIIIRDMDSFGKSNRLSMINNALQDAYSEIADIPELTDTSQYVTIDFPINGQENEFSRVEFACLLIHKDGGGEIEDILRAIKIQKSHVADCIDKLLPNCLEQKGESLKDKELNKLWINHYQRYDTLKKKDRTAKNTSPESVMRHRASDLYDFDNQTLPALIELKTLFENL
ncbi:DUF3226 domain-containing protein [Flectobacillus roseus]